jgi:uncharacterized protein (TIGR02117 family)
VKILAVMIAAGCFAGCSVMPTDAPLPEGQATVFVVHRGWHTDIGLPVEEVTGPLASVETSFPGVRYIVFGFGERAYYMARDTTSAEMLTALFPSKSAILVTALSAPPAEAFADHDVVTLHMAQTGVDRITASLWLGLEKTSDGSARRLAEGPYAGSVFFASNETYHAFHTCNTWTAGLLRNAGMPIDPSGVLFASQVMHQVKWIAAMQVRGE